MASKSGLVSITMSTNGVPARKTEDVSDEVTGD